MGVWWSLLVPVNLMGDGYPWGCPRWCHLMDITDGLCLLMACMMIVIDGCHWWLLSSDCCHRWPWVGLVIDGLQSWAIVNNGCQVWPSIVVNGLSVQLSIMELLAVNGLSVQWAVSSVVNDGINGSQWWSMAVNGCQWCSMAVNGDGDQWPLISLIQPLIVVNYHI